jgi:hypothetical protein
MVHTDEEAAALAIASFIDLSDDQLMAVNEIRRILETDRQSPFVDVHKLLCQYDALYFRNLLLPRVEVIWSARLTL